jgi:hypothetical protein
MHDGHALGGCLATVHVFSIDARMSDGLDVANYSECGNGVGDGWDVALGLVSLRACR